VGAAGFLIIGHRGARGLYPENTLEGVARAWAAGVRYFEIDIGATADGVPVLYHDLVLNPNITRGPDGAWLARPGPAISALTLAELAQFDVGRIRPGTRYAARYPRQVPADGARIPTLEAVLHAAPEAGFTVELKTDPTRPDLTVSGPKMAERVVAVAEAARAAERIRVQSFDWRGPRHLGRVRPDIARAWLTEPKTVAAAPLWWGVERRGESVAQAVAAEAGPAGDALVWAPEHRSFDQTELAEARALGLAVIPWTVNEANEMVRLKEWGAAGLITDRPDLAVALDRAGGRGGEASA